MSVEKGAYGTVFVFCNPNFRETILSVVKKKKKKEMSENENCFCIRFESSSYPQGWEHQGWVGGLL